MDSLTTWLIVIVTAIGYLLSLILIRWVLITRNRTPISSVAWILAIIFLPYLGGILFIFFGVNRIARRTGLKQAASRAVGRHLVNFLPTNGVAEDALNRPQQRLQRLTSRVGGTVPTTGNEIELLDDTNRTLGLIRQAILAAKETLHLEYYIWQPDKTGTELRDLLIQRAREGIKIRFLYDGVGSLWLGRKFLQPMRDAGIHAASFLPGPTFRERWSINLRNHRKIVIVDGRLGFTGGMNIGNEYHGKNRALGYWRDTHLRMRGPSVLQLQQIFAEDWFYATGEELTHPSLYPAPESSGNVTAQVISGEPAGDARSFLTILFAAINEARNRITLSTSYFVPPDALATALETAALRGVRVRVLLAGKAEFHWTVLAGRSYYDPLLRAGCQIWEYQRGLMHAKTLTVDGHWSLVGSPNFDNRSLMLNFEAAVALYDTRLSEELEEQFEHDLTYADEIQLDKWVKRPRRRILVENACRLFAPVL